jgi:hypothetical protein
MSWHAAPVPGSETIKGYPDKNIPVLKILIKLAGRQNNEFLNV